MSEMTISSDTTWAKLCSQLAQKLKVDPEDVAVAWKTSWEGKIIPRVLDSASALSKLISHVISFRNGTLSSRSKKLFEIHIVDLNAMLGVKKKSGKVSDKVSSFFL